MNSNEILEKLHAFWRKWHQETGTQEQRLQLQFVGNMHTNSTQNMLLTSLGYHVSKAEKIQILLEEKKPQNPMEDES